MSISRFINAVIVDTCAYEKLQYDFTGNNSSILLSLKQILYNHDIKFVSSIIIKREILKHIISNAQEIKTSINKSLGRLSSKYKDVLPIIGIKNISSVIEKANKLDLVSHYTSGVDKYFSDAIMLPLTDAENIFNKYFDSKPPFSESGDKKSEFPDAFVIESILGYANCSDCDIIVISNDMDWKNSLRDKDNIILFDDIKDAINYIQELYVNDTTVYTYCELTIGQTADLLQKEFINSAFYIEDYYAEVIEVTEVELDGGTEGISEVCPLLISNSQIIYSARATINACVRISSPDMNSSIYDSEEKEYMYIDYVEKEYLMKFDIYFEAEIAINEDKSVADQGSVQIINFNNNEDILVDYELDVESMACY